MQKTFHQKDYTDDEQAHEDGQHRQPLEKQNHNDIQHYTSITMVELINVQLSYGQQLYFVDIFQKEMKTYIHTKTCSELFIETLTHISQNWKQSRCSLTIGSS